MWSILLSWHCHSLAVYNSWYNKLEHRLSFPRHLPSANRPLKLLKVILPDTWLQSYVQWFRLLVRHSALDRFHSSVLRTFESFPLLPACLRSTHNICHHLCIDTKSMHKCVECNTCLTPVEFLSWKRWFTGWMGSVWNTHSNPCT